MKTYFYLVSHMFVTFRLKMGTSHPSALWVWHILQTLQDLQEWKIQKFRSNHCHKSSLPLVSQIFFDLADTAFFFFPLLLLLLLLWRQVLFSSSLERKVFCTGSDSSAVSSQPRNAQCWKLHLLPSSLNHGKLELTRTEAHWVSQLAHSNHREHSNLTPPLLSVQALHTLTCSPEAFISIP